MAGAALLHGTCPTRWRRQTIALFDCSMARSPVWCCLCRNVGGERVSSWALSSSSIWTWQPRRAGAVDERPTAREANGGGRRRVNGQRAKGCRCKRECRITKQQPRDTDMRECSGAGISRAPNQTPPARRRPTRRPSARRASFLLLLLTYASGRRRPNTMNAGLSSSSLLYTTGASLMSASCVGVGVG